MGSKQVLVMKKFPKVNNIPVGKYVSQGSHASIGALFSIGKIENDNFVIPLANPFIREWIVGNFRKIVVYVESDEELRELYLNSLIVNIPCALIEDNGLTLFKGIPTLTAVGIGPADEKEIDKLTGHLSLF